MRVIAFGQLKHLLHLASMDTNLATNIKARHTHWCRHWREGAALARNWGTLPDLEQNSVDANHFVVHAASLIENNRVFDWAADRAATPALNAVSHHHPADVHLLFHICIAIQVLLSREDLLGSDDVVVVSAVGAAISTSAAAQATRGTTEATKPTRTEVLAHRILIVSVRLLVHLLDNRVARTEATRAAAVHPPVLAARRAGGAAKEFTVTTFLSLRQMFDLPILAAADAIIEIDKVVVRGSVLKPRHTRAATQLAIVAAVGSFP